MDGLIGPPQAETYPKNPQGELVFLSAKHQEHHEQQVVGRWGSRPQSPQRHQKRSEGSKDRRIAMHPEAYDAANLQKSRSQELRIFWSGEPCERGMFCLPSFRRLISRSFLFGFFEYRCGLVMREMQESQLFSKRAWEVSGCQVSTVLGPSILQSICLKKPFVIRFKSWRSSSEDPNKSRKETVISHVISYHHFQKTMGFWGFSMKQLEQTWLKRPTFSTSTRSDERDELHLQELSSALIRGGCMQLQVGGSKWEVRNKVELH